jgi:GTP cyclohydrolase I
MLFLHDVVKSDLDEWVNFLQLIGRSPLVANLNQTPQMVLRMVEQVFSDWLTIPII